MPGLFFLPGKISPGKNSRLLLQVFVLECRLVDSHRILNAQSGEPGGKLFLGDDTRILLTQRLGTLIICSASDIRLDLGNTL